jgi:hypothetical protein
MEQQLTLTYQEALAGLKQAVEDRGDDFTYPDEWRVGAITEQNGRNYKGYCVNFRSDSEEPACIAGYVYALNGILPDSENWRDAGVDALAGRDGSYDLDEAPLKVDARTYILLEEAQRAQDEGLTWGASLRRAEHKVEAYDRSQTGND